jgi:hypothetical protein
MNQGKLDVLLRQARARQHSDDAWKDSNAAGPNRLNWLDNANLMTWRADQNQAKSSTGNADILEELGNYNWSFNDL